MHLNMFLDTNPYLRKPNIILGDFDYFLGHTPEKRTPIWKRFQQGLYKTRT